MSVIDEALSANVTIAHGYDPSRGKPPAPKIAIVTCADPRLSSIEQMLGLAEGDVDMIRNFGTVIDDDAVRSLVLSTRFGSTQVRKVNGPLTEHTGTLGAISPSHSHSPHGAGEGASSARGLFRAW